MQNLEAVIFDMDGVLVDSEMCYMQAIISYLHERGFDLTPEEFSVIVGQPTATYVENISRWFDRAPGRTQEEVDRGAVACVGEVLDAAIADPMPYRAPGLPELLERLKAAGLKLAIASSSTRREVEDITSGMGVLPYFDFLVTCDDVEHTKPAPDIYLLALERLGVEKDRAIAVEDSDPGIAAARAAGLRVAVKRDDRFSSRQKGGSWYLDEVRDLADVLGV